MIANMKIISGGQTGVDRAALDFAIDHDIQHGGWCPKGRKAEDGVISSRYQLSEMATGDYLKRTRQNIADSDATLILNVGELVGGTKRTVEFAHQLKKPFWIVQLDSDELNNQIEQTRNWIRASITTVFCRGPFEEGERELRHLSDDQAICIGYANTMEDTGHLPPAHWLARQIGRQLFRFRLEKGAGQIGPDAKVIVRVETDDKHWQPKHVSISLNHHEGSDWFLLRRVAEEAVETACAGKHLPDIDINGAGMFVSGGPNGDNGLSGKKLVVDAYGPTIPIGGGAWSGKDLNKVDRLGG